MDEKVIVSAYCIIERDGKILFTEDEGKQGWKLPGGKAETGESFVVAAIREVKEETGFDVELTSIVNIQEYFRSSGTRRLRIYTKAKITGGKEQLAQGEVKRIYWIPKDEAAALEEKDYFIRPYYLAMKSYFENRDIAIQPFRVPRPGGL